MRSKLVNRLKVRRCHEQAEVSGFPSSARESWVTKRPRLAFCPCLFHGEMVHWLEMLLDTNDELTSFRRGQALSGDQPLSFHES